MCFPATPKAPAQPPQRQMALSPYASSNAGNAAADQLRRRMGLAATIMTPPGGPAAASLTGKTLLGA
jgi:hypothetical protein